VQCSGLIGIIRNLRLQEIGELRPFDTKVVVRQRNMPSRRDLLTAASCGQRWPFNRKAGCD
jgi:hypothetical protein